MPLQLAVKRICPVKQPRNFLDCRGPDHVVALVVLPSLFLGSQPGTAIGNFNSYSGVAG